MQGRLRPGGVGYHVANGGIASRYPTLTSRGMRAYAMQNTVDTGLGYKNESA